MKKIQYVIEEEIFLDAIRWRTMVFAGDSLVHSDYSFSRIGALIQCWRAHRRYLDEKDS